MALLTGAGIHFSFQRLSRSKQWVWSHCVLGRRWRVIIREITSCLREILHLLIPLFIMLWRCCWEHFWSAATCGCDSLPAPTTPVHLKIWKLWQMISPWLSSPSPATYEGKAETICWRIKPDDQRSRQTTEGSHMSSGCPKSWGTHGLILTKFPGLWVTYVQAPSDKPC